MLSCPGITRQHHTYFGFNILVNCKFYGGCQISKIKKTKLFKIIMISENLALISCHC